MFLANSYSSGNRELKQPATMLLLGVFVQWRGLGDSVTAEFSGCVAVERCMRTRTVVVIFENYQLPLQIAGIPEEDMIKKLTKNGADESPHEGV